MPILSKPVDNSSSINYEGLLFRGYAEDDLKKYQMCQLACDINRVSNSSSSVSPFYTARRGGIQAPITLWNKIDENRILFLTIENAGSYSEVKGTILLTSTDPNLPVTPTEDYEYSGLLKFINFITDAFCFCILSNKDKELFILKATYTDSDVTKNKIYTCEITSANKIKHVTLDGAEISSSGLLNKQCFAFSNYIDNQFILVDYDETTGNMFTGQYEIDSTFEGITLLNSTTLTGFTGLKLLTICQLDNNDFYGVFSSVVASITIIHIYQIRIDSNTKSWKVDEFNLGREYPTLSCAYDNGYITILGGYDNVSMRTFIYFINSKENIVEVYKKNRKITQPDVFDAVQGIMTLNNGLAYMTYSSTRAQHNAGFVIMDNPNQPIKLVENITQLPNTFSAKSPPLTCNNNVYFLSVLTGASRTYQYQVFAFYNTPVITEFRPYNNQFGVCQTTANKNDATSLLYTSPIGEIIDMG